MLHLLHALQDEAPDHWRAVAQAWGVDLPARDPLGALVTAILDPARVAECYGALPASGREAIESLRAAGGKIPVAIFFHRFGEIRAMGPARRQREQPWRDPVGESERLWYGGWIGRAFIRSGGASQEYVFLPADLAALLPAGEGPAAAGRRLLSYLPGRHESLHQAGHDFAEDACTLLAFLRAWPDLAAREPGRWLRSPSLRRQLVDPASIPLLIHLLTEQKLIDPQTRQPDPDTARDFLDLPVSDASARLADFWSRSDWNDLEQTGEFLAEGGWPNDAAAARLRFLDRLHIAPEGEWCTIDSLLAALHETDLEFLRPAAAFDSWNLKDRDGEYLRGLDSWWRVEAALVRYWISGPLAWLGRVDLTPREAPLAFRITSSGDPTLRSARARSRIRPDGTVLLETGGPLMPRYQLARCADWLGRQAGVYLYRLSPRALLRARSQGIRMAHILSLLEKLFGQVPHPLKIALQRWEEHGPEITIRPERVLAAGTEETARKLVGALEPSKGIVRKLDGPVWVVSAAGSNRLRSLTAELGYLVDESREEEDE